MESVICTKCRTVFETTTPTHCPKCNAPHSFHYSFHNSDTYLKTMIPPLLEQRKKSGLQGLIGGLQAIVINTELQYQLASAQELLTYTGFQLKDAFENDSTRMMILKTKGSADILLQSRKQGENPFHQKNIYPKSQHLPNTRLETFIFNTSELEKYVCIQKEQGIEFL